MMTMMMTMTMTASVVVVLVAMMIGSIPPQDGSYGPPPHAWRISMRKGMVGWWEV
jgi:hypothetical protein